MTFRLPPVRRRFGLRWPSHLPPRALVRSWLFTALAIVLFFAIIALIQHTDRLALAEAQAWQRVAGLYKSEQALVALINERLVAIDSNVLACKATRINLVGDK